MNGKMNISNRWLRIDVPNQSALQRQRSNDKSLAHRAGQDLIYRHAMKQVLTAHTHLNQLTQGGTIRIMKNSTTTVTSSNYQLISLHSTTWKLILSRRMSTAHSNTTGWSSTPGVGADTADTETPSISILLNKIKCYGNTTTRRAHLMHHYSEMILTEKP